MHAIKDRPVVVDGQIVIRPIMVVALTYDHRLLDGREAVTFLGMFLQSSSCSWRNMFIRDFSKSQGIHRRPKKNAACIGAVNCYISY